MATGVETTGFVVFWLSVVETSSLELVKLDKNIVESDSKKTFYEWLEAFIEDQSKEFTKGTVKHNKVLLNHLKAFFGKKTPTFDDINFDFYNSCK